MKRATDGLRYVKVWKPASYDVFVDSRQLGWIGQQYGLDWVADCTSAQCRDDIHMRGYPTRREAAEALLAEHECTKGGSGNGR
jgi:hypothetical protein